jgi:maltose alpha-D-glucosyltransferase/alpha-amylase
MVTDEERDYMYRVYAGDPQQRINLGIRRRLAPLLANSRREIELMNGLLLSLPGTPVVYYGDEIGMGDNVYLGDRNGVRTPMQWSADRNAGFSEANPQRLYFPVITDPEYHYESVNVAIQRENPNSLWWWTKRALALRKRLPELSRGTFEVVPGDNAKVLSFVRRLEDRTVLVVANLSRHAQPVTLDLSEFAGLEPLEVLGNTKFPIIGEGHYTLAAGPRDCYWFVLEAGTAEPAIPQRPAITLRGELAGAFRARAQLQRILVSDITTRRWFRSKTKTIRDGTILDLIDLPGANAHFAFLKLEYADGDPETYAIPVSLASGIQAAHILEDHPEAVIADVTGSDGEGILYDGMYDEAVCRAILSFLGGRRKLKSKAMSFSTGSIKGARAMADETSHDAVRPPGLEQTNTSIVFGDNVILKLFRKVEPGPNPEVEVGRFLTEKVGFAHAPRARGLLRVTLAGEHEAALAYAQEYVPNQGNAFDVTNTNAVLALENILAQAEEPKSPPRPRHPLDVTPSELEFGRQAIGAIMVDAELLGIRTAEMHLALAASVTDPVFRPEPMSTLQQRSLYQAMRTSVRTSIGVLRRTLPRLAPADLEAAHRVVDSEEQLLGLLQGVTSERIDTHRIRIHGDYHLGQVLNTGKDFVIIDFEGEPLRPLSQRRLKRLALRDVAGMIRSYHYAMVMSFQQVMASGVNDGHRAVIADWAHAMHRWAAAAFLDGYRNTVGDSPIVPANLDHFRLLLDSLLVEKAAYELEYELNNRPDWVEIPLRGILEILD